MFQAQFQTFDDASSGAQAPARIAAVRAEIKARGLSGFILPRADAHQNEYVPPSEERLAWLTGFTGSAGTAIITADRAVLFVDGRYTLQARDQIDASLFTIAHLVETPPAQWIG
ncbi:MAG: aminopeptidase P family N-terminal domain-containing protein, partial [Pseudorhodoplanes sp.]|nr:aminopeptidase P family N-terminal domain-containing protein [Pseudorhodoplanes sp.]